MMRAVVLRDWDDLAVEEIPIPEPGEGEALVRVAGCGICGTDLKIVAGAYEGTWPPSFPFVLGHEWAGEVVSLGPGAEESGLRPGDRVAAENHAGCGMCRNCRAGSSLPSALSAARRKFTVVTPGIAVGYWNERKRPSRARSSALSGSRS